MSGIQRQVERYFESVDAGDVEGVVGLFAANARYERPGYDPMIGTEALREFYGGERVIASGRHTVTSVLIEDDSAAVQGRFQGTLKDGSRVDLRFADFFRVDAHGLFAERRTYFYSPMV